MMAASTNNVATMTTAAFRASRPVEAVTFSAMQRVVSAVFACALFFGFGAVLLQLCGMTAADVSLAGCAIAGVVAIAACVLLAGRGKLELRGLAVMAAVVVIAAVAFSGPIVDGLAVTLNHLQMVLDARTAVYGLPYAASAGATATPFCALFAFVLGALCAQVALRGNVLVVTVLALAAAVPLVLGYVGFSPWLVVLAAGLAGSFVGNTAVLNQVNAPRGVALGALAAVVVLGAVAGIAAALTFASPLDGAHMRSAATQALEEARYGRAEYAMPQGKIAAAGARQASDRVALQVTTGAPVQTEYLRGYVGDTFSNGAWQQLSAETVTEASDLFYWLREDGFSAASQLADAARAVGFAEAEPSTWAIAYEGAPAQYAYLPYTYAGDAQATFTTDFSQARRDGGAPTAGFSADAGLLWKAYRLQVAVAAADTTQEDVAKYRTAEQAYRTFVYDNYLAIPQSAAETFARLFGDGAKLTSEEAKALVSNYFDNYVSYNDEPKKPAVGTDVVSHFLAGGQEGYSIHYATAATLMLRYYGVPARYVEGYMLRGNPASDARTFALTEADAHAWVEYYLDGVGWIVYDPTPGYGDESRYEKTDNTTTSPLGSLFDQGSQAGSTWVPEVTEEEPEEEPESRRDSLADFGPNWLLWLVVGVLAGLVVAFVVRAVLLRRRHAQRLEQLKQQGDGPALAALFAYGIVLGERGLHAGFANEPYASQAERAEESHLADAALFAQVARVNDHVMFAGEGAYATPEEQAAVNEFVDQATRGVNAHASAWDKFLLKFVYCIM